MTDPAVVRRLLLFGEPAVITGWQVRRSSQFARDGQPTGIVIR
jgi:hypothetical protein